MLRTWIQRLPTWNTLIAVAVSAALLTACNVTNPGDFALTSGSTSVLRLRSPEGNTRLKVESIAGCANGIDDDYDGSVDLDDVSCTGAADNNERSAGSQSFIPLTIPLSVASNGAVSIDASDVFGGESELCIALGQCISVSIEGNPGLETSYFVDSQLVVDFRFDIALVPAAGFVGMGTQCTLGPIEGQIALDSYGQTTGAVVAHFDSEPIPATTTCGSSWNPLVNSALGLPGGSANLELSGLALDSTSTPIQVDP